MAFGNGPKIVSDGLILSLDASDRNSYSGSGAAWNDLSGNGLNVTLVNSPTYITNPNSLLFDGVDEYGSTGNNTLISSTNSLSFDFWVKPTGTSTSSQTILGKDTNSSPSGHLLIRRVNSTDLRYNIANGSQNNSTNFFVGSIDNWVNIQITYNYTSGDYNVYKNGVLFTNTTTASGFPLTNAPINIASYSGPPLPWTGNISVCKIYNRALSSQEVLQNYNALKSRFGLR
jgi:hypothetical protein